MAMGQLGGGGNGMFLQGMNMPGRNNDNDGDNERGAQPQQRQVPAAYQPPASGSQPSNQNSQYQV